jgi:thioredoxin-related protein
MKKLLSLLVVAVVAAPALGDDPKAEDLFKKGFETAKKDKKHVFLWFRADNSICEAMDKYHADADVKKTLEKYFVVVTIDLMKNEGAPELYGKYGGMRGTPAWTILDSAEKVIGDSGDGMDNVGFPVEPKEFDQYFKVFKKAYPKLADAEVELLTKKMKAFKPDIP